MLTFLSVIHNMSQDVCCPNVVTRTVIQLGSSLFSLDVFGCFFLITISFVSGILNAWKQGDSELDHLFVLQPVIHASVPMCIGSSVHRVQESNPSLTKRISTLFCTMNVQFHYVFLLLKPSAAKNLSVGFILSGGLNPSEVVTMVSMFISALSNRRQLLHQGPQYRETALC